ncbi:MAG TPA: YlmC/YmxH family sporulation protein [Bacillales bacterium]|nr:YlmC/YmxH family sporulation protein [Bacillales bacterium]
MSKISEFQAKDVVNVSDGKVLGHIGDLEINTTTGKIDSLIIPGNGRMMGLFGRESDVVISWRNIVRIGTDVILVRFHETDSGSSIEYKGDYKKDS